MCAYKYIKRHTYLQVNSICKYACTHLCSYNDTVHLCIFYKCMQIQIHTHIYIYLRHACMYKVIVYIYLIFQTRKEKKKSKMVMKLLFSSLRLNAIFIYRIHCQLSVCFYTHYKHTNITNILGLYV